MEYYGEKLQLILCSKEIQLYLFVWGSDREIQVKHNMAKAPQQQIVTAF
jgi:hypothetical protein